MKNVKFCKITYLLLLLVLSFASNVSAQNEQESAPDFGQKMGEIFNEALQETLEEALPGSTALKTPDHFSPTNGQNFTHFPRNVTFTWEQIPQSHYELVLDCLGCTEQGKWNSDMGQFLAFVNDLKQPFYNYEFPADKMGRWRVRAVRNNVVSDWSEWSFFNFNSGAGPVQNTDPYNKENANPGWEEEQYDPYGENPYQGYDNPYENQQGDQQLPSYGEGVTNEPQQPSQSIPVAEENPGQGAVAPPQAGVPEVQVNTNTQNKNNSVIKKIPKSVLVKPAESSSNNSTQSGTNKKFLPKPIDE